MGVLWNELMYVVYRRPPLFIVRAWVGVEMAGVPVALGVHELGVDPEEVGPRKGVRGRAAWCGVLSTEASYGGRSWRPEVAVRRAEEEGKEEEEEKEARERESDVCEEEPGCLGWTPHL